MRTDPTKNALSDFAEASMEMTRISTGGSFEAGIAPSAAKIQTGGTVDSSGNWQPYGRVDITPISDFRAAP